MVVDGPRQGDVISVGGPVEVKGTVEGSVWTFGSDVTLRGSANVTGDVVAVGGKINAERGARIGGNKQALPSLQIPFLGFLTSPQSAETLLFILDLFSVALFLTMLFLAVHFRWRTLTEGLLAASARWRSALLYLLVGVVVVPILVAFLTASLLGIMVIPLLFVLLLVTGYLGFLSVNVRVGQLLSRSDAASPTAVYIAGLLGYAVIRGPSLLGRMLALATSDSLVAAGRFLKFVGSVGLFAALLYGVGVGLAALRSADQ